ncbi:hypothetical protein [Dermatophilus congolensis]|uniref:hypothetical protein n=8 Tax=Dermatophilus congolensis TaxID=1863 RepID=UPI001AAF6E9F|nr:hypothetical protein [Dermatophilus congolensis]MBO3130198.1 transporter [Dermatophilus congolensis]MBO3134669.1 transporter [Dermatophilus congolensis]MBO3139150.1 transporter [Dermatophilus congolensis]MBO3144573.1 transporter [Dermatophilus congolensis]MBO3148090.1 transporter [Dermatophilus congolensis]
MTRTTYTALTLTALTTTILTLTATTSPTRPTWWPILTALLVCAAASTAACAIGATTAICATMLSSRAQTLLDALFLFQLTIPPFIIGSLLKLILGRTSPLTHLIPTTEFTGPTALILTYAIALTPPAHFGIRVALRGITASHIDAARVAGLYGPHLLKIVLGHRLALATPCLIAFLFSIAMSDPVTPALVAPRLPFAASEIWFRAHAFDQAHLEAGQALLLVIPHICVLAAALCTCRRLLLRNPELPESFRLHTTTADWSRPVGSHTWIPTTIVTIAATTSATLITVMILIGSQSRGGPAITEVVINTMGLAFLVLALALALASVALHIRKHLGRAWGRHARRTIDALFLTLLTLPGATIGTGLRLSIHNPNPTLGNYTDTRLAGLLLACLPAALALTYLLTVIIGPVLSRDDYEIALLQGVRPLAAFIEVVLPRSTNIVICGFLVVFSQCAALAAPLLWVSPPDTPLVMLRLFKLLDAADYPDAFRISATVSILVATLAAAMRATIQPHTPTRPKGRR